MLNQAKYKGANKYKAVNTVMLSNGQRRVFARKNELTRIKKSQVYHEQLEQNAEKAISTIKDAVSYLQSEHMPIGNKMDYVLKSKNVWQKYSKEYERKVQDRVLFERVGAEFSVTRQQMSDALVDNIVDEDIDPMETLLRLNKLSINPHIQELEREMEKRVQAALEYGNGMQFFAEEKQTKNPKRAWRAQPPKADGTAKREHIRLEPKEIPYLFVPNDVNPSFCRDHEGDTLLSSRTFEAEQESVYIPPEKRLRRKMEPMKPMYKSSILEEFNENLFQKQMQALKQISTNSKK